MEIKLTTPLHLELNSPQGSAVVGHNASTVAQTIDRLEQTVSDLPSQLGTAIVGLPTTESLSVDDTIPLVQQGTALKTPLQTLANLVTLPLKEQIDNLSLQMNDKADLSGFTATGSIDMLNNSVKYNNTLLLSPNAEYDILNIRRYSKDYTLVNMMAPPQTSWGGAREATLALVRGDNNEFFLDIYNMDYGPQHAGDYLNWGEAKMGMRMQKRGSGFFTPFYIEYGDGTDTVRAMEIFPGNTEGTVNGTRVNIVKELTVGNQPVYHRGNLEAVASINGVEGAVTLALSTVPAVIGGFNPSLVNPAVSLSPDLQTATFPSSQSVACVYPNHLGGLRYIEFTYVSGSTSADTAIGLVTDNPSLSHQIGYDGGPDEIGMFQNTGRIYVGGALTITVASFSTLGTVVGMAVDAANRKVWYRVDGGEWNLSPSASPETGVGGIDIPGTGSIIAAVCTNAESSYTVNTSATLEGALPWGAGDDPAVVVPTDVAISQPTEGDILYYTQGRWVNTSLTALLQPLEARLLAVENTLSP